MNETHLASAIHLSAGYKVIIDHKVPVSAVEYAKGQKRQWSGRLPRLENSTFVYSVWCRYVSAEISFSIVDIRLDLEVQSQLHHSPESPLDKGGKSRKRMDKGSCSEGAGNPYCTWISLHHSDLKMRCPRWSLFSVWKASQRYTGSNGSGRNSNQSDLNQTQSWSSDRVVSFLTLFYRLNVKKH
jgi:hypothetical protein